MTPFQMEALVESLDLSPLDLSRLHEVVGWCLSKRGGGSAPAGPPHDCESVEARLGQLEEFFDSIKGAVEDAR